MKTATISELKKSIRSVMDENLTTTQLLSVDDTNTLSLDDMIGARIVPSIRIIETHANERYLQDAKKVEKTTILCDSTGRGIISLPSDMMRLVSVMTSAWKTFPLIITHDDPLYLLQSSIPGIRGSYSRPVAALVPSNGHFDLELYPAKETDTITLCQYIPTPVVDKTTVTYCEQLEDAIIYYAAYMAGCILKNNDNVVPLRTTALMLAGISSQNPQSLQQQ